MGNKLRRQRQRLSGRRVAWNVVRGDKHGYRRPGSMNGHKSFSVKSERGK